MDNVFVSYITDNSVLLTLRSEQKNSLTQEIIVELATAFDKYDSDPKVDIICFTGSERAFCTGMNLEAMAKLEQESAIRTLYLLDILLYKVLRSSKLIISAINGHAVGSGAVLALATDYRLIDANEKIKIGFPEYPKGISLPGLMREIIAKAGLHSARMLLMGEFINPMQAAAMELVDELCEVNLLTRLQELCAKLNSGNHNYRLYKQHFKGHGGYNMPQADDPEYAMVVSMVQNSVGRGVLDA